MHRLVFPVAELLGRPGEYRDIHLREPLEGVATGLARPAAAPLEGDLRAESVIEGILVTGRVRAPATLRCARCLTEFAATIELGLCELYAGPGQAEQDDDAYEIRGTEIDLEPMLRDAVTLALPLNPLCRTECKGICATCGVDLNAGACNCADETWDPRWAPLDALRQRLEERSDAGRAR